MFRYNEPDSIRVPKLNALLGNLDLSANTRTDLANIDPSFASIVYLKEGGREGVFMWDPADWTSYYGASLVAIDPNQIMFVAPTSDPTGASGAWVRQDDTLTPFMAGAVGDAVTDDLPALTAFNEFIFNANNTIPLRQLADWTGRFGISGQFVLGPNSAGSVPRWNLGGIMRLTQLTPTFETLRVKNLIKQIWKGGFRVTGLGSNSFASRTCGVGIALENCGNARFDYMSASNFWLHGICTPTVSNDELKIGHVIAGGCGSGWTGGTLSASFTGSSNTGTANSYSQRSTLSGVTAFPDEAITTYKDVGDQPIFVEIDNQPYFVTNIDRAAGTIKIFPWLDAKTPTSGSLNWVFGAGLAMWTNDGNIITVDHVAALTCGIGLYSGALYGPRILSANCSNGGVGLVLGQNISDADIGTHIDAYYAEANAVKSVIVFMTTGGTQFGHIASTYTLNETSIVAMGPRDEAGDFNNGRLGDDGTWKGFTVAMDGRHFELEGRNFYQGENSPTKTFRDHTRKSRIYTMFLDSHTVNLSVEGGDDWNRLWGYKGATWRYVGTGTNNAPTGTITFNVPKKTFDSTVSVSGSADITRTGGRFNGVQVGMPISGSTIAVGATVLSISADKKTLTMSAAATGSATNTVTVTGKLNGAYSNVSFSNFTGPVDFAINHKDPWQMNWVVAPVTGWWLRYSATYDPPSIAAGGTVTTTIAAAGAAFGDRWVATFNKNLNGMLLSAYVNAADSVTVVFFNPTGAAIDLASGTLSVARVT